MQRHLFELIALILCHSSLWGSMTGKGLWPCLRHCMEDNPSAQHHLLSSGRILGIEDFSHVLTWASSLPSSRVLHLLPSLKNQSVFQASPVLTADGVSWVTFLISGGLWFVHHLSFQTPALSCFIPSFPCTSQEAPLRTDLKLCLCWW